MSLLLVSITPVVERMCMISGVNGIQGWHESGNVIPARKLCDYKDCVPRNGVRLKVADANDHAP